MPVTSDMVVGRRRAAIAQFCAAHGVRPSITGHIIWTRSADEANELTTLIAREWDSAFPPPLVGVDFTPEQED